MAVKQSEKNTANVAPAGNVAPQAGNGADTATTAPSTAPKRRGRAKGSTIGPRLVWNEERDLALAAILKDPEAATVGPVKTAASVAQALSQRPEFANPEAPVTPERVKAHLESVIKDREKKGKPVHDWLKLSVVRSRINSELFD